MLNRVAWPKMIRGGDCIGYGFKLLDSIGCQRDINSTE